MPFLTLDRKTRRLQGQAPQIDKPHMKTLFRKLPARSHRPQAKASVSHSLFTLSKNPPARTQGPHTGKTASPDHAFALHLSAARSAWWR